jgi:putative hydrolase of the HAD superfamily
MRFLDNFSVLLLDMNGTFMFGHDRFGPEEDYFATYQALGGSVLGRAQLLRIMEDSCQGLLAAYSSAERFDDFPTLAEAFLEYGGAVERELPELEQVFAVHELGYIPAIHQKFLREAARTHHLGVVSNICARPEPWFKAFRDSELLSAFKTLVFSSEGRSIKPSKVLFERALATLPPGSRVLFAGDSLERDIIPAKALGLATAWVAPPGSSDPSADVVVQSLPDLAELAT